MQLYCSLQLIVLLEITFVTVEFLLSYYYCNFYLTSWIVSDKKVGGLCQLQLSDLKQIQKIQIGDTIEYNTEIEVSVTKKTWILILIQVSITEHRFIILSSKCNFFYSMPIKLHGSVWMNLQMNSTITFLLNFESIRSELFCYISYFND